MRDGLQKGPARTVKQALDEISSLGSQLVNEINQEDQQTVVPEVFQGDFKKNFSGTFDLFQPEEKLWKTKKYNEDFTPQEIFQLVPKADTGSMSAEEKRTMVFMNWVTNSLIQRETQNLRKKLTESKFSKDTMPNAEAAQKEVADQARVLDLLYNARNGYNTQRLMDIVKGVGQPVSDGDVNTVLSLNKTIKSVEEHIGTNVPAFSSLLNDAIRLNDNLSYKTLISTYGKSQFPVKAPLLTLEEAQVVTNQFREAGVKEPELILQEPTQVTESTEMEESKDDKAAEAYSKLLNISKLMFQQETNNPVKFDKNEIDRRFKIWEETSDQALKDLNLKPEDSQRLMEDLMLESSSEILLNSVLSPQQNKEVLDRLIDSIQAKSMILEPAQLKGKIDGIRKQLLEAKKLSVPVQATASGLRKGRSLNEQPRDRERDREDRKKEDQVSGRRMFRVAGSSDDEEEVDEKVRDLVEQPFEQVREGFEIPKLSQRLTQRVGEATTERVRANLVLPQVEVQATQVRQAQKVVVNASNNVDSDPLLRKSKVLVDLRKQSKTYTSGRPAPADSASIVQELNAQRVTPDAYVDQSIYSTQFPSQRDLGTGMQHNSRLNQQAQVPVENVEEEKQDNVGIDISDHAAGMFMDGINESGRDRITGETYAATGDEVDQALLARQHRQSSVAQSLAQNLRQMETGETSNLFESNPTYAAEEQHLETTMTQTQEFIRSQSVINRGANESAQANRFQSKEQAVDGMKSSMNATNSTSKTNPVGRGLIDDEEFYQHATDLLQAEALEQQLGPSATRPNLKLPSDSVHPLGSVVENDFIDAQAHARVNLESVGARFPEPQIPNVDLTNAFRQDPRYQASTYSRQSLYYDEGDSYGNDYGNVEEEPEANAEEKNSNAMSVSSGQAHGPQVAAAAGGNGGQDGDGGRRRRRHSFGPYPFNSHVANEFPGSQQQQVDQGQVLQLQQKLDQLNQWVAQSQAMNEQLLQKQQQQQEQIDQQQEQLREQQRVPSEDQEMDDQTQNIARIVKLDEEVAELTDQTQIQKDLLQTLSEQLSSLVQMRDSHRNEFDAMELDAQIDSLKKNIEKQKLELESQVDLNKLSELLAEYQLIVPPNDPSLLVLRKALAQQKLVEANLKVEEVGLKVEEVKQKKEELKGNSKLDTRMKEADVKSKELTVSAQQARDAEEKRLASSKRNVEKKRLGAQKMEYELQAVEAKAKKDGAGKVQASKLELELEQLKDQISKVKELSTQEVEIAKEQALAKVTQAKLDRIQLELKLAENQAPEAIMVVQSGLLEKREMIRRLRVATLQALAGKPDAQPVPQQAPVEEVPAAPVEEKMQASSAPMFRQPFDGGVFGSSGGLGSQIRSQIQSGGKPKYQPPRFDPYGDSYAGVVHNRFGISTVRQLLTDTYKASGNNDEIPLAASSIQSRLDHGVLPEIQEITEFNAEAPNPDQKLASLLELRKKVVQENELVLNTIREQVSDPTNVFLQLGLKTQQLYAAHKEEFRQLNQDSELQPDSVEYKNQELKYVNSKLEADYLEQALSLSQMVGQFKGVIPSSKITKYVDHRQALQEMYPGKFTAALRMYDSELIQAVEEHNDFAVEQLQVYTKTHEEAIEQAIQRILNTQKVKRIEEGATEVLTKFGIPPAALDVLRENEGGVTGLILRNIMGEHIKLQVEDVRRMRKNEDDNELRKLRETVLELSEKQAASVITAKQDLAGSLFQGNLQGQSGTSGTKSSAPASGFLRKKLGVHLTNGQLKEAAAKKIEEMAKASSAKLVSSSNVLGRVKRYNDTLTANKQRQLELARVGQLRKDVHNRVQNAVNQSKRSKSRRKSKKKK